MLWSWCAELILILSFCGAKTGFVLRRLFPTRSTDLSHAVMVDFNISQFLDPLFLFMLNSWRNFKTNIAFRKKNYTYKLYSTVSFSGIQKLLLIFLVLHRTDQTSFKQKYKYIYPEKHKFIYPTDGIEQHCIPVPAQVDGSAA